jgi:hypothetical protein
MNRSSLIVAITPILTLIALFTGALKRIGASQATGTEYLYVPCVHLRGNGHLTEARRWVQQVPVVKKTATLIYYASDSWNPREAVVSPGCISREQFEADTRRHREHWCRQGYPAGVIPVPGDRRCPGADRLFFATREAAEDNLRRRERERAARAAREVTLIKELRRAMADAHPDHGGTSEQFIQAHRRYQTALGQA